MPLATGFIPTDWKAAKVIPLFKSGSTDDRPISILPSMSKLLERVVHIYKQLMAHLEQNSLLSHFQYGFRHKRCTDLAVTHLTDAIRREAENDSLTGCAFICEFAWFTDYLCYRSQVVQLKGVLSEPQPIFAGVPQGSILGPVLLIIHFNDVYKPLKHSKIVTYANDSVIYTSSKDVDIIQQSLSEDMNNLCDWFKDNELIINIKKDKTKTMLFGTSKRSKVKIKIPIFLLTDQTLIMFLSTSTWELTSTQH